MLRQPAGWHPLPCVAGGGAAMHAAGPGCVGWQAHARKPVVATTTGL